MAFSSMIDPSKLVMFNTYVKITGGYFSNRNRTYCATPWNETREWRTPVHLRKTFWHLQKYNLPTSSKNSAYSLHFSVTRNLVLACVLQIILCCYHTMTTQRVNFLKSCGHHQFPSWKLPFQGASQLWKKSHGCPLENVYIAMENHHVSWENQP